MKQQKNAKNQNKKQQEKITYIKGFELVKQSNAKDIVAIEINGEIKDLSFDIPSNISDESVKFISKSSDEGLDIIRHSTAHLLTAALKNLYKNVKFTIGPAIEKGFYYDIDSQEKISEADFPKIENEMKKIVDTDLKFIRKEVSKKQALSIFKDNPYKIELINSLDSSSIISIYEIGDYVDLCVGPHVPSSRYLKYFKLTKISGAYWKGDQKNKQLQRIYGTAWDSKIALDNWFVFLQECERRDHKKICKAMDLCHWEPEYAPGSAFWHPNGWFMWQTIINWLREVKYRNGYVEGHTPRVMNRILWEKSGHWAHYGEHNYGGKTQDEMQFAVKPMNCPGGILIFNNSPKSYRDLPIRLAEFGEVNRFEASGSLNGLLRCREFTQDDAHVWCTEEQLEKEILNMHDMFYQQVYEVLGFHGDEIRIVLSLRPENRIPNREHIWDASEKYLENVLQKKQLKYTLAPGEGAFYGPKLEYSFKDALGRWWQIGTIQLDMNLPERFNMSYVGADGKKHIPCMLHAACFGSIDRFLGMYIETIEGKFPLWFNPIQACILNINTKVSNYCEEVYQKLKDAGLRVKLDLENRTLQQKIAIHSTEKIPYLLIIGDKEKESKSISIRIFSSSENSKLISMKVDEFIKKVIDKVNKKSISFEL